MKRLRTAALVLLATVCLPAYSDDQALANLIASLKNHTGASPSPVSLTAVDAKDGRNLGLRFTVTNISGKPLQIDAASLPWGSTYSIFWVAVTRDGHVLPVGYPIDDPVPGERVSLFPGQSLTGTYHLDWMLDRSAAPRNTDIAVLWLYSFPAGPVLGRDSRPFCTGVTVVHVP